MQDYDLSTVSVLPALDSVDEATRVVIEAFSAAGCDVRVSAGLPHLFAEAGIGRPDGTEVAGRLEPLADAHRMLVSVFRSILPAAITHGITTEEWGAALLAAIAQDAAKFPDLPVLWPLLIGACWVTCVHTAIRLARSNRHLMRDHADVASHDPGRLDVAALVVDGVRTIDPTAPARDRRQPQMTRADDVQQARTGWTYTYERRCRSGPSADCPQTTPSAADELESQCPNANHYDRRAG